MSLLAFLKLPIPAGPIYLRLFGGACTAFGVAYWFAYQDPVRNVAIVKAGLADNGLITLIIFSLGLTGAVSSAFILISGLLTALFFVSFMVLMPRKEGPPATQLPRSAALLPMNCAMGTEGWKSEAPTSRDEGG